jgi:hypothetical protein
MGKSSKNSGLALGSGTRGAVFQMFSSAVAAHPLGSMVRHYGLSAAALPSVAVALKPHSMNY